MKTKHFIRQIKKEALIAMLLDPYIFIGTYEESLEVRKKLCQLVASL